MKKLISLILAFTLIALPLSLASCGKNEKPVIGILQFGSHASLTNCYDGILDGLRESGIDLDEYELVHLDSNFDPSVAQTQARMLCNRSAAVILAIATPSAVAAATAADGDIPVIFCAVTDSSTMENYDNVTGSSDIPNFEKQLICVTSFMGKTDLRIGVLYSTDESSSPFQVSELQKAASAYDGMEILTSAVSDITTIETKVNELVNRGADCFVNLLDNTIVGKLSSSILPITNEKGIPVFGSEIEQVKVGCVASASIEYRDVGFAAGKAAADILGGKSADDIPVAALSEPHNYYNSTACALLGLTLDSEALATDSFLDVAR